MKTIYELEKDIALAILKREIEIKKISIPEAAEKIGTSEDILNSVFTTNGKHYASHTLIYWAEIIATSSTPDDVVSKKLVRKRSSPPEDIFYREVWRFISNL